ncbi:expressed protein [Chlorella variabilis]|uniref:Expressed protein n=1 Tax=Chlorella variabilis TaxID=554065 RepID=E1ZI82_CHLVA|nr:expressed protein [Chlorella variabilis]EFN54593.1 expressed protein [Chlorella variabilis]|eukprot:XP_005846695.1 expressed protein [Chlorella variabilis]
MWYLSPGKLRSELACRGLDPKWCKQNEKLCKLLGQVELTGPIGSKRMCSIASHDYKSEEAQDLCIVEHGGIHLVFDAEGSSNPLDSPSLLYVTDLDSECDVMVNGKKLDKGERTPVKPGSVIAMGEEAQYQVQRNVFAHA